MQNCLGSDGARPLGPGDNNNPPLYMYRPLLLAEQVHTILTTTQGGKGEEREPFPNALRTFPPLGGLRSLHFSFLAEICELRKILLPGLGCTLPGGIRPGILLERARKTFLGSEIR